MKFYPDHVRFSTRTDEPVIISDGLHLLHWLVQNCRDLDLFSDKDPLTAIYDSSSAYDIVQGGFLGTFSGKFEIIDQFRRAYAIFREYHSRRVLYH